MASRERAERDDHLRLDGRSGAVNPLARVDFVRLGAAVCRRPALDHVGVYVVALQSDRLMIFARRARASDERNALNILRAGPSPEHEVGVRIPDAEDPVGVRSRWSFCARSRRCRRGLTSGSAAERTKVAGMASAASARAGVRHVRGARGFGGLRLRARRDSRRHQVPEKPQVFRQEGLVHSPLGSELEHARRDPRSTLRGRSSDRAERLFAVRSDERGGVHLRLESVGSRMSFATMRSTAFRRSFRVRGRSPLAANPTPAARHRRAASQVPDIRRRPASSWPVGFLRSCSTAPAAGV